jgi:Fe-S oxidoreductase
MFRTLVKTDALSVADQTVAVRYFELRTMRGARRYSAEILLAPGDRIILDDDSVTNLEARTTCSCRRRCAAGCWPAVRRRLIVRWLFGKNDPREEGAATSRRRRAPLSQESQGRAGNLRRPRPTSAAVQCL